MATTFQRHTWKPCLTADEAITPITTEELDIKKEVEKLNIKKAIGRIQNKNLKPVVSIRYQQKYGSSMIFTRSYLTYVHNQDPIVRCTEGCFLPFPKKPILASQRPTEV